MHSMKTVAVVLVAAAISGCSDLASQSTSSGSIGEIAAFGVPEVVHGRLLSVSRKPESFQVGKRHIGGIVCRYELIGLGSFVGFQPDDHWAERPIDQVGPKDDVIVTYRVLRKGDEVPGTTWLSAEKVFGERFTPYRVVVGMRRAPKAALPAEKPE